MGMKVGGSSSGAISDINVTPLVDVVLVLLVSGVALAQTLTPAEVVALRVRVID